MKCYLCGQPGPGHRFGCSLQGPESRAALGMMTREGAEQRCTAARAHLDDAAALHLTDLARRELAQQAIQALEGVPGEAADLLRRSARMWLVEGAENL